MSGDPSPSSGPGALSDENFPALDCGNSPICVANDVTPGEQPTIPPQAEGQTTLTYGLQHNVGGQNLDGRSLTPVPAALSLEEQWERELAAASGMGTSLEVDAPPGCSVGKRDTNSASEGAADAEAVQTKNTLVADQKPAGHPSPRRLSSGEANRPPATPAGGHCPV
eukprot:1093916-Rhodomonas_salina.1